MKHAFETTEISFDWFELLELKIILKDECKKDEKFRKEFNLPLKSDYTHLKTYRKVLKAFKTY